MTRAPDTAASIVAYGLREYAKSLVEIVREQLPADARERLDLYRAHRVSRFIVEVDPDGDGPSTPVARVHVVHNADVHAREEITSLFIEE